MLFECSASVPEPPPEAAIAACLLHSNIVATLYSDVRAISSTATQELSICKLYLVQVCNALPNPAQLFFYTDI